MKIGRLRGAARQLSSIENNSVFNFENKRNTFEVTADKRNRNNSVEHAWKAFINNRARDSIFGQNLFFDPSWDIMLLLHASSGETRPPSLEDICAQLPGSTSTIVRYVAALEGHGLLTRETREGEFGSTCLRLTPLALQKMDQALALGSD